MVNSSDAVSSPSPPPLGSLIDNGTLELVEVLGYGGYGVVYRAVDTFSPDVSYAVKCLPHSQRRNASRQRQLHLREITLHQLASAHPNVVTLHRVVEDYQYTYIVMDYCPDGDLFSQILHHRRYLGNSDLIKEVFLQLLDAVEYCHSLNIYHRDLKPENVLCFEDGLHLAITDFGLATTEKMSTEFRTGSVYHMSPECQGGIFAPTKSYSPMFNDIWSLGIILLNLITGRNPWKSAAADDCTFQAYLRDPMHFLPTVLPISDEANYLLTRVLEVDWRRRITLREMRHAIMSIDNFYSPEVVFEESMARCPWETGVQVDSDSETSSEEIPQEAEPEIEHQEVPDNDGFVSSWSESGSDMVFATQTATEKSWADSASYDAPQECFSRSMSPSPASPLFRRNRLFDPLDTPTNPSSYSVVSSSPSIPSAPATPGLDNRWSQPTMKRPTLKLTVDTAGCHADYYDNNVMMASAVSSMHTALESQVETYGMYSPYLSAVCPEKTSLFFASTENMGVIVTPITANDDMDVKSAFTYQAIDADQCMSPFTPGNDTFGMTGSTSDSVTAVDRFEYNWEQYSYPSSPANQQPPAGSFSFLDFSANTPAPSEQSERDWCSYSFLSSPVPSEEHAAKASRPFTASYIAEPPSPAPLPIRPPLSPASRERERKARSSSFLNPIRLAFPRRSSSPAPRSSDVPLRHARASGSDSAPAYFGPTNWVFSQSTSTSPSPQPYLCLPPAEKAETKLRDTQRVLQRRRRLRSAAAWFSPSKLFSAVLA